MFGFQTSWREALSGMGCPLPCLVAKECGTQAIGRYGGISCVGMPCQTTLGSTHPKAPSRRWLLRRWERKTVQRLTTETYFVAEAGTIDIIKPKIKYSSWPKPEGRTKNTARKQMEKKATGAARQPWCTVETRRWTDVSEIISLTPMVNPPIPPPHANTTHVHNTLHSTLLSWLP